MHTFKVGELYHPNVKKWPEGSEFNWDQGGASLILRFNTPSRQEVEAARKGKAEFALLTRGDVLFFLYRFGENKIPWSDCPFSWHLVPQERRALPPVEGELTQAVLQVILLDATTGIIKVLRLVSFSPDFTRVLLNAIRVQASTPWPGNTSYDNQIQQVYAHYPSTTQMLSAAQARCVGGEG